MRHPYYETARQIQTDPARYIECRGGGHVQLCEIYELHIGDALRAAASQFRRFFGAQPETVEEI